MTSVASISSVRDGAVGFEAAMSAYHLNSTWVQCCVEECAKWRHLRHCYDPSAIPDWWTCSMNSDVQYSSCDAAEEVYEAVPDPEYVDYLELAFSNGSVVWGLSNGIWWPAMVTPDPVEANVVKIPDEHSITVDEYHVTFFGSKPVQQWIDAENVRSFLKWHPRDEKVRDAAIKRTLSSCQYNTCMKKAQQDAMDASSIDDVKKRIFTHQWKGIVTQPSQETIMVDDPSSTVTAKKADLPAKRAYKSKVRQEDSIEVRSQPRRKRTKRPPSAKKISKWDKIIATIDEVVAASANGTYKSTDEIGCIAASVDLIADPLANRQLLSDVVKSAVDAALRNVKTLNTAVANPPLSDDRLKPAKNAKGTKAKKMKTESETVKTPTSSVSLATGAAPNQVSERNEAAQLQLFKQPMAPDVSGASGICGVTPKRVMSDVEVICDIPPLSFNRQLKREKSTYSASPVGFRGFSQEDKEVIASVMKLDLTPSEEDENMMEKSLELLRCGSDSGDTTLEEDAHRYSKKNTISKTTDKLKPLFQSKINLPKRY